MGACAGKAAPVVDQSQPLPPAPGLEKTPLPAHVPVAAVAEGLVIKRRALDPPAAVVGSEVSGLGAGWRPGAVADESRPGATAGGGADGVAAVAATAEGTSTQLASPASAAGRDGGGGGKVAAEYAFHPKPDAVSVMLSAGVGGTLEVRPGAGNVHAGTLYFARNTPATIANASRGVRGVEGLPGAG